MILGWREMPWADKMVYFPRARSPDEPYFWNQSVVPRHPRDVERNGHADCRLSVRRGSCTTASTLKCFDLQRIFHMQSTGEVATLFFLRGHDVLFQL